MLKRIAAAMMTVLLMCGCSDSREPAELAYVQMMGIDSTGVALQILTIQGMTSGEDEGVPEFSVIYGKGETLAEALAEAELSSSRRLFLGHCRLIVLASGTEGYTRTLRTLIDRSMISPACEIAVAAKPFSIAECETEEKAVSTDEMLDILENYSKLGEVKKTTAAELFGGMLRSGQSATAPLLTAEDGRLYAVGTAAITEDGYAGQLSRRASMGIALLCGKGAEPIITLELENGCADLKLTGVRVKRSAAVTAGKLVYRPVLVTDAEIISVEGEIESELLEYALENRLSELMEAAVSESLVYGCDALELELTARKYCGRDMRGVDFGEKLRRSGAEIAVYPTAECRVYG